MCRKRPPGLPEFPVADFKGGQCCDVFYDVTIAITTGAGTTNSVYRSVYGTIRGLESRASGTTETQFFLVSRRCNGNVIRLDLGRSINPATRKIINVVRTDGQADTCGDPPILAIDPVVVPPVDRSTNVTFAIRPGVNITVPVVLIYPTLRNTFELKPSLTINAKVGSDRTVNYGDRIINFHLYPDGWYSEPGHPAEPAVPDPQIDYFINPPDPDDDPFLAPRPPSPPATFQADPDVPGAKWLRVELTKLPDKAHYGKGTPNVYFAGWLEFTKGGDCLPRQQVNFQKSLFRFPDGANGYYVQFTNGAAGKVTVYTEVANA
jgi:hypothetical protein